MLPGVIALSNQQNAGQISNSGFIVGRDGVAVIDTGGSMIAGKRLLAAIRTKTDLPVLYVIFTHGHPDHTWAPPRSSIQNLSLSAIAPSRTVAGDAWRRFFARDPPTGRRRQFSGTRIVAPTLLVDGVKTWTSAAGPLKLESWPSGHTNADLTVTDEASGAVYLGDLLFSGHVPALDGSLTGWLANLKSCGNDPSVWWSPAMVRLRWPGRKRRTPRRRYLRRLRDDVRDALRKGETIREAAESAAASERPKWWLFGDFTRATPPPPIMSWNGEQPRP